MTADSTPPVLRSKRTLNLRFDIPISRTKRFWDELGEGRFVTTKCKTCGQVTFPPQADCPHCMSDDHDWVDLGTDAELVTATLVRVTPTSFVDNDPYVVAVGMLAGGTKVLAWLEGDDLDVARLKPGAKLRVEARKDESDSPYYVFVRGGSP